MPSSEPNLQGKYEILARLGGGGMGEVYKVRHRLLGEVQVVKVVRPGLGAAPGSSERFLREARSAIQLRHPNVAQLLDFSVEADGSASIVMEWIDGVILEELLARSGPPSIGLALAIGLQSLRAIGFLHRRGFVHRDIAPDNLMLARDVDGGPLVKLIDLGLAKLLGGGESLTVPGTFLGKPLYASPEQLGPEARVDGRSDLYSFGVVLYELLTGRHPFAARGTASLIADQLFRPPLDFAESDPGGRLPADLRAVLLAALAKKPEERIATAEEFARRLEPVQARFPVAAGELDRALGALAPAVPIAAQPPAEATVTERTALLAPRGPELPTFPLTAEGAPPAPAPPPARRSAAAPSGRWALAALLLVPALLLGGLWLYFHPDEPDAGGPAPAVEETPAAPSVREPGPEAKLAERAGTRPAEPPPTKPAAAPIPKPAAEPVRTPRPKEAADPEPPAVSPASPAPAPVPAAAAPRPTEPAKREAPAPRGKEKQEKREVRVPVVTSGSDFEDAQPLAMPEVTYPEAARGSGQHPWISVEMLIDEKGQVLEAHVEGGGDKSGLGFNEAAREAAMKVRFKPATQDGVPVRTKASLTFQF